MLPPDENTKKSGVWASIKGMVFGKIIKNFYDGSMYEKYKEITIKAMFYEIDDKIARKELENVTQIHEYFNLIFESYKRTFFISYNSSYNTSTDMDFVRF